VIALRVNTSITNQTLRNRKSTLPRKSTPQAVAQIRLKKIAEESDFQDASEHRPAAD
jgi:hypothetical protein